MVPARGGATNYNDRVLDAVRAALGIPRGEPFGLEVPAVILPVVVVDPDSPPILQFKGVQGTFVAASAANFSVAAIQNVGGLGGILKAWCNVIVPAGVATGVNARLNQGSVDTYTATNSFTEQVTPAADSRLAGPSGTSGSGVAKMAVRNTLAAPWAPPGSVSLGLFAPTPGIMRIGPVWLDQFDAFSIEGQVINQAIGIFYEWEYFAPVR